MPLFKALTHGNLSNPYREVVAGEVVVLTDAEAKLYEKSKWLRPKKEVDEARPQPLMPHMRIVGGETVSGLEIKMPAYAVSDPKIAEEQRQVGGENFNDQIAAMRNIEDGKPIKKKGTGNQDPLA